MNKAKAFAICLAMISAAAISYAETPLEKAASAGDLSAVRSLIKDGSDVNAVDADSTWEMTPLIAAAASGHAEVVKTLLDHGADAGMTNAAGASPLRLAVQSGHADVVEVLLNGKADPDFDTDYSLRSPLVWAVLSAKNGSKSDYSKIISLLVGAGAKCQRSFKSPFDDSDISVSSSALKAGQEILDAYEKACPDVE